MQLVQRRFLSGKTREFGFGAVDANVERFGVWFRGNNETNGRRICACSCRKNGLACGKASGELNVLTKRRNESYGYLHLCVVGDLAEEGRGEGGEKELSLYDSGFVPSKVGCCINKVVAGQLLSDNVTASGNFQDGRGRQTLLYFHIIQAFHLLLDRHL